MTGNSGWQQSFESSLIVCSNPVDLSLRAASQFAETAQGAVAKRGRFTVCLSGGFTPRGAHSLLASERFRNEVPWQHVHVFWGDERCIPLSHPDNHYRMAHDLMLSKVAIPTENVHPILKEGADPHQAAREYEILLRSFFALRRDAVPRFDLILLGMGADGHTASLFPGTAALEETERLVVVNYVTALNDHRLTVTLSVINNAEQVMFLVSGSAKAEALRAVLQGREAERDLPAKLVRPVEGAVLWLVDEAAAALLSREGSSLA